MIKIKGIKEAKQKLNKIIKQGDALNGQQIPLVELLNPSFLQNCSRFSSCEEMIEASGFKVKSSEDFKAIPDEEWDHFINSNTRYSNWTEMLSEAGEQWVVTRMNL